MLPTGNSLSMREQPRASVGAESAKSNGTSSVSSATKRKRGGPKFYAVKAGHKPGIYYSWADTLEQITNFKHNDHKSFDNLSDAEAYLRGELTSPATQRFYGVQRGRVPGVYTNWSDAQKQTIDYALAKAKGFATRAEAEAFVAAGKAGTEASATEDLDSEVSMGSGRKGCKLGQAPANKRQRTASGPPAANGNSAAEQDIEPGTGPLPADAEDGFDRRVILNPITGKIEWKSPEQMNAMKLQSTGESKGGMLNIWTDGSSLSNGRVGAISGVGVFFGPNDSRNISEGLLGGRQTNQRAELTAIQRALELAPLHRDVMIHTDSNYAINCVTKWYQQWRRNNWMTAAQKPVENRDLIEAIVNKLEERARAVVGGHHVQTKFTWCKGHADEPGNVAADQLAVNGARQAKEMRVAGTSAS